MNGIVLSNETETASGARVRIDAGRMLPPDSEAFARRQAALRAVLERIREARVQALLSTAEPPPAPKP